MNYFEYLDKILLPTVLFPWFLSPQWKKGELTQSRKQTGAAFAWNFWKRRHRFHFFAGGQRGGHDNHLGNSSIWIKPNVTRERASFTAAHERGYIKEVAVLPSGWKVIEQMGTKREVIVRKGMVMLRLDTPSLFVALSSFPWNNKKVKIPHIFQCPRCLFHSMETVFAGKLHLHVWSFWWGCHDQTTKSLTFFPLEG